MKRYLGVLAVTGVLAGSAHATNADLQALFIQACANPTANLALRCADTGGSGDLSSDSESSLNPSQSLSSSRNSLYAGPSAQAGLPDTEQSSTERLSFGRLNVLVNAGYTDTAFDRRVDLDAERAADTRERTADVGLDYRFSDAVVAGVMLHWQRSETEFIRENAGIAFTPVNDAGSIDIDGAGATLYINTELGARAYLDASITYLNQDYRIGRNAVFQESTRTVAQVNSHTRGRTDGTHWSAAVTWGYSSAVGSWSIAPSLGVLFTGEEIDGYTEDDLSASGLAMQMSDSDSYSLTARAGLQISRAVSVNFGVLLPYARATMVGSLSNNRAQLSARYVEDAGGNLLQLTGDARDDNYWNIAAGISAILPNGWMPFAEYRHTGGIADTDRWQVIAGLRVAL